MDKTSTIVKYLAKEFPELSTFQKEYEIRYYILFNKHIILRLQSCKNMYSIERKERIDEYTSKKTQTYISHKEFNILKRVAHKKIERFSYVSQEYPQIKIKQYLGKYKGLIRAEITVESKERKHLFSHFPWIGPEITTTPLAQDATLLTLKIKDFQKLLQQLTRFSQTDSNKNF